MEVQRHTLERAALLSHDRVVRWASIESGMDAQASLWSLRYQEETKVLDVCKLDGWMRSAGRWFYSKWKGLVGAKLASERKVTQSFSLSIRPTPGTNLSTKH